MSALYDPEALAIEAVLKLDEVLKNTLGATKCKSLARRASELPQLVSQAGLLQATLFYLSKSDDKLLPELAKALRGGKPSIEKKSLEDECGKEGKGYTLGLALLSYALTQLAEKGLLSAASEECKSLGDPRSIAKCLLSLRENRLELSAEKLLEPYLNAVKRLADALHREREQER